METFIDYWDVITQSEVYRELARQQWKFICPTVAIALVFVACLFEQIRKYTRFQESSRLLSMMLLPPLMVVAFMAVANYNNFANWRYGSFFNAYEFYHYYIGSKYAPEVHYKDLYNATLIADAETGLKFRHAEGTIKNLNPHWREDKEPYRWKVEQVLAQKERVKARFTPERWEEFVQDIKFFKSELVGSRWDGVLRDKGYNGSPAWSTVVGGLLSNNFPTSWRPGMVFLASLDLIMIAIAMGFVIWAYGLRSALLMLVLWGSSYVMSYSHMKGAYLRTDFVMPIIISMCLIKKNHYAPAGILMGYASIARVFPTVFLFGVGARMVWITWGEISRLFGDRKNETAKGAFFSLLKVNKSYILFFVCVLCTVVLMAIAPIVYTGSTDLWMAYKDKIADHADDISPWRVGFKYLYIGQPEPQKQYEKLIEGKSLTETPAEYVQAHLRYWFIKMVPSRYNDHKTEWYAIMLLMLAVCLLGARGLKDHDAIAFSFVPCFFLAAPTYYYYIMLLIPMLFFVPYLNRPSRVLGAIALLAMAMPGYYLYAIWQQKFPTYYWHSVMYFGLCLYMILLALIDTAWAFYKGAPHAPYLDDRELARKASEKAPDPENTPQGLPLQP